MRKKMREEFSLTYKGSALDDGAVDARQLAHALTSVSAVMNEAQNIYFPGTKPGKTYVRATKQGSFEVDFSYIVQGAVGFLNSREISAVLNAGGIIGLVCGAFTFTKKFGSKNIESKKDSGEGSVELEFEDGTKTKEPKKIVEMISSDKVRRGMKNIVAPLQEDGVEELHLSAARLEEPVEIKKEEIQNFDYTLPTDSVEESESLATLVIGSVVFDGNAAWDMSLFNQKIKVRMADKDFRKKMDRHDVAFSKGDELDVRLLQRKKFNKSRVPIEVKYFILEVLAHREIPAPEQLAVFKL